MTAEQIKEIVEFKFSANLNEKSRSRYLVYTRAVYFKLCRKYTHLTLSAIGKTVGKDHATVLHGIRLYDEQVTRYSPFHKKVYKSIAKKISGKIDMENLIYQSKINDLTEQIEKLQKNLHDIKQESLV